MIDLPRWQWLPILYGIVLNTRPRKSAAEYAKVWTTEGSPLLVTSRQQAELLEAALGARGIDASVRVAMRYGEPSTRTALDELEAAGVERVIALPMYPQYASATTGSSVEELLRELAPRRVIPPLAIVPPYFDHPGYVQAIASVARASLGDWTPDHIVLSFHGVPERYVREGDPYRAHCEASAAAIIDALQWPSDRYTLSFQSRFGREVWLQPYTDETLRRLGQTRTGRVAVLCPGFTADCLETLEEIGARERRNFLDAGGVDLRLVPCLNTSAEWIEVMADLVSA